MKHEYLFDCTLTSTISVKADTQHEAARLLRDALDGLGNTVMVNNGHGASKMTRKEAYDRLPADAQWDTPWHSGNPGQIGYIEYFRCADGRRFNLVGPRDGDEHDWAVNQISDKAVG